MTPTLQSSGAAWDLTRLAYLYAIRRDWRPETRLALLGVVEEMRAEARVLELMEQLCGRRP